MKNRIVLWIWLVALVLAPIVLWILPGDFFDDSEIVMCLSRLVFDFECWGCGMTRAVMHFHHFEFEEAIFYNMGVVAVYPFLIWLWFSWVKGTASELNLLPVKS